ncbi:MAG: HypC/HybG/HupF family hydrogenase formation chaperone [bacterium]|nr:HypC/HybG/HupF family hydrogenase formation chaperone [bacterium]
MCLAVEGRIIEIDGYKAKVDFGGVIRDVRLELTPEAKVGDYVLVHAGYAIKVIKYQDVEIGENT